MSYKKNYRNIEEKAKDVSLVLENLSNMNQFRQTTRFASHVRNNEEKT